MEIAFLDGGARHEGSLNAVGSGTLTTVAPGRGIMVHRHADRTLRGYAALNKPEAWIRSIDFSEARAGLALVAREF